MRHDVFATSLWSRSTNIDEVDLLEILLWDFVWPVENIPSSSGGRSQVKPAIQCTTRKGVFNPSNCMYVICRYAYGASPNWSGVGSRESGDKWGTLYKYSS